MALLELCEVSKTYRGAGSGQVEALREVSLRLEPSQFVAIRGPSGCGKSSLLLTAGTLLGPDSGEVRIGGELPYQMSGDQRATFRASNLGFVFQQFHLVPYLSVLENVLAARIPLTAAAGGNGEAIEPAGDGENPSPRQRADDLLRRFGLGDRLEHTPGQLSSGERQRCALARAMFNRPGLLLADEPTGNLDPQNGAIVLAALREFADQGGGVLLVTHDQQASDAADQVLSMRDGRLSG